MASDTNVRRGEGERPFRIAYVGWTGKDNIGDEIGPVVFERMLAAEFPALASSAEVRYEVRDWPTADATVACLGTLLDPYNYRNDWMRQFRAAAARGPLVGVGLGALPAASWEEWPTPAAYRNRFLDWFSTLSVRGGQTARMLGLPDARISGDTVFGLEWVSAADAVTDPGSARPLLAVNVGEWSRPLRSQAGGSLVELIREACLRLESHFRLLLFSMGARDDESIRSIAAALSEPAECSFERDVFRLSARLARCDLGMTMKCHASGLLYACGVPTVNVAYQPKCADLATVLSEQSFVLRGDRTTVAELVASVRRLESELSLQRERLAADVARQREVWRQHFRANLQPLVRAAAGEGPRTMISMRLSHAGAALPAYTVAALRRVRRRLLRRRAGRG